MTARAARRRRSSARHGRALARADRRSCWFASATASCWSAASSRPRRTCRAIPPRTRFAGHRRAIARCSARRSMRTSTSSTARTGASTSPPRRTGSARRCWCARASPLPGSSAMRALRGRPDAQGSRPRARAGQPLPGVRDRPGVRRRRPHRRAARCGSPTTGRGLPVGVSPRIGITKAAGEPLRFYARGNPSVSGPRALSP